MKHYFKKFHHICILIKKRKLMKLKVSFLLVIFIFISISILSYSQTKIKWYSMKEAIELSKKQKKKIFIDMYTSWCGWCKHMDANTFSDTTIAKYMNKYFICVKFDAEGNDTIVLKEKTYVNSGFGKGKSTHQMVYLLLQGQIGYPAFIILDEKHDKVISVMGYKTSIQFEPIIKYYGEDIYKKKTWEEYMKDFKGEIK